MAAGRHGGYRDNEFRDRESDFEVARREIGYSKGDYDRMRNGVGDYDRGNRVQNHDGRDRGRVRQKDIKERECTNGGYRSASSRSDSGSSGGGSAGLGPKRYGFCTRPVDREPGELSSESGSDGAIDSEAHKKDGGELKKSENGKRKFSPIIWDRDGDGKKVTRIVKARTSPAAAALPAQPPTPTSGTMSPDRNPDSRQHISPSKDIVVQNSGLSPTKVTEDLTSQINVASDSPIGLSPSVPEAEEEEAHWGKNDGAMTVDDDYYMPARNIKSSRWANEAESSADEGEISDDDEMVKLKKRKKKSVNESTDTRGQRKSVTPELGELRREGSVGNRARSSDERVRSFSGDSDPDELDRNDYMEVDEDRSYGGTSDSNADTGSDEEHNSHGTPQHAVPPPRAVNMLQGCRSVDEFERLNKIDEGTYGVVYRARDKRTGEIVALKKVKMDKEREGFPLTSLREINILLSFHHPSIVDVKEVVVGSSLDSIFMVMEYMEHDLKGLMETMKQPFSQSEVKCLMLQLLEGVKYLHDNWVLHRDLKTSNILLNNCGELKICDFGLARQYGSPLKPYTHLVVTLWYRAPELLLGAKQYSTAIDMWSLGCIMAELLAKQPLFNGKTEVDQLDKIFKILGTPNDTIWPGFSKLPGVRVNFVKHQYNQLRSKFPATSFRGSPVLSDAGFDLLNRLLTYDPEKRITAEDALSHPWFSEVPLPKSKEFMPTFPAQHAQDRRMRRAMKSPDPLEEQRRKELQQGELGNSGLFG